MPYLNDMGGYQRRQRECAGELHHLRGQQNIAAIFSVRENTAEERKKENRNLAEKGIQPEIDGRVREL